MDLSLLKHTRPLLAALGVAFILASCGDGSSPTASDGDGSSQDLSVLDDAAADDAVEGDKGARDAEEPGIAPGEPHPGAPPVDANPAVADVADLIARMGDTDIVDEGEADPDLFGLAPRLVTVNGEEVRIYAYESVELLKREAGTISPDAGMLGGRPVRWMAAPHFYARDVFLVLYVGVDEEVLRILEAVLGTPIAGERAYTDDALPPDPGIDDDPYAIRSPAMIVAGTEDEVDRLAQVLQDPRLGEELSAVDLRANWVVAVFRGQMSTAGYGIEIEDVRVGEDGTVVVEVSLENPPTDGLLATVLTYPVDVAVVPRTEAVDPREAVWVAVTDSGKPLARFGAGATSSGSGGIAPPATDVIVIDEDVDDVVVDGGSLPVDGEPKPHERVNIRGTITTIEVLDGVGTAGVLARILIESPPGEETEYDRAWVEVIEDTDLSFDGETFAPPTLRDLEPGRSVQVVFTGPVRESYPVQAVARTILILR